MQQVTHQWLVVGRVTDQKLKLASHILFKAGINSWLWRAFQIMIGELVCASCASMCVSTHVSVGIHAHVVCVRFGVCAYVCGLQYTFQVRNQELHLGAVCCSCRKPNKSRGAIGTSCEHGVIKVACNIIFSSEIKNWFTDTINQVGHQELGVVYFSVQKSRVGGCTRSRLARGVDVRIRVCVCRAHV